ncbi:putative 3-methyladenine DNA glycosylase [Pararobbsia alpina]|uniref:DNA-3-methyladenine glycosylase n=1 Tax=Pararobbsia alpina TaxID=621374 RepID=UPI0039A7840E
MKQDESRRGETESLRALRSDELPSGAVELARWLVGKWLTHDTAEGCCAGRIVEVEAYPVGDSTGYAYRGLTRYNAPLFKAPGFAYVKLVYGAAWTLNISAEPDGIGAGVLLRALEPRSGIELMQSRRGSTVPIRELARGPGRLCAALGVGVESDGKNLCTGSGLWLGTEQPAANSPAQPATAVGVTTRIGLSREMDRPLRFFEIGNRCVSGPRRLLTTLE